MRRGFHILARDACRISRKKPQGRGKSPALRPGDRRPAARRGGSRAKDGGSIVPPKGGVRMEYLIMLVVILLVLDSIFRNKKR